MNRHFLDGRVSLHGRPGPLSVKAGPELSRFYLPELGTQPDSRLTSNKSFLCYLGVPAALFGVLIRTPREIGMSGALDSRPLPQ